MKSVQEDRERETPFRSATRVSAEALRNEIKDEQIPSYTHPEQKWIFGQGSIYHYGYFDAIKKVTCAGRPWRRRRFGTRGRGRGSFTTAG